MARALGRPPLARHYRLVGLCDQNRAAADALARRLPSHPPVFSLAMLIRRSDLVLEAASAAAAPAIITRALAARRRVLAMSAGGVLRLAHRLETLTRRGGELLIPSGAIAGLDGLKAARTGGLQRVTLTTRKPPQTLAGAPGARRHRARLARLTRPLTLFRGTAARAVTAFPQNINVAATLALAGLGAARTQIRIIADPTITRNIHEIEAVGRFGRLTVRTENRPSPQNPKTSELAIESALAALGQLPQRWRIGT